MLAGKPEKGLEITNDISQANDDLVAIFAAINDESGKARMQQWLPRVKTCESTA